MSLTKTEVPIRDFITTGTKAPSAGTGKRVAIKAAEQLSTGRLVWLLVKRHKVALLAAGNVILVLNWAFPAWPEVVKSFI